MDFLIIFRLHSLLLIRISLKIKVKWDDELIYDGIFRNRYQRALYTVNLNPKHAQNYPAVVQVGRATIFARGEKPNIV